MFVALAVAVFPFSIPSFDFIYFHFCRHFMSAFLGTRSIEIADAPIFIYIHGGYWQILDKTVSAYGVEPLVNSGIKVIVLDYELCPNVSLEQLVDQVQRAAAFIVKYATTLGSR